MKRKIGDMIYFKNDEGQDAFGCILRVFDIPNSIEDHYEITDEQGETYYRWESELISPKI